MSKPRPITRRTAMHIGAAAALPLVHVSTAGAAGKLSLGFWDHWVPRTNDALRRAGQPLGREEQGRGHDRLHHLQRRQAHADRRRRIPGQGRPRRSAGRNWDVINYADGLEPVDDVATDLQARYGQFTDTYRYLGHVDQHWRAVPTSTGSLNLTCEGRISLLQKHAGMDVQAMYPAAPSGKPIGDDWTYDAFLAAAEACHKAGVPFGLGLGSTDNSINNTGSWFAPSAPTSWMQRARSRSAPTRSAASWSGASAWSKCCPTTPSATTTPPTTAR